MKVLGNPIFGKMFRKYSLSLKEDGLYRIMIFKTLPKIEYKITDSPNDICDLLRINFSDIDGKSLEECVGHITNSPVFDKNVFTYKEETLDYLKYFTELIKDIEYIEPSEHCSRKDIKDILNIDIDPIYDRYEDMSNTIKTTIEKKIALISDKKKIYDTLNRIKDGRSTIEYLEYMYDVSDDDFKQNIV